MRVAGTTLESDQVDVGIEHLVIVRATSSNLQDDRVPIGSILQVVTFCYTSLES